MNFQPLAPQNLQGINNPFNEPHQAVGRLPRDRMVNEKLRLLSFNLLGPKLVIIQPLFPDLQSRAEEAACSPRSGTETNQLENLHLHDPAEQLIRSGYLFST